MEVAMQCRLSFPLLLALAAAVPPFGTANSQQKPQSEKA
jgi:hypothetical protein